MREFFFFPRKLNKIKIICYHKILWIKIFLCLLDSKKVHKKWQITQKIMLFRYYELKTRAEKIFFLIRYLSPSFFFLLFSTASNKKNYESIPSLLLLVISESFFGMLDKGWGSVRVLELSSVLRKMFKRLNT